MPNVTTFVSSASVTITPTETPTNFALPAFDAGNLDMTVQNTGTSPVSLGFGALPAGLTVPAGVTVLLTGVAGHACGVCGELAGHQRRQRARQRHELHGCDAGARRLRRFGSRHCHPRALYFEGSEL